MRLLLFLTLTACARPAAHVHPSMTDAPADPSAYGSEVVEGVTRARAATAAFKNLDSAVAKGYAAKVAACISDSSQGTMGFHHLNRSHVDEKVEVEKPEFLLYERKPDGSYVLNAVEYIIPYRAWPKDSVPPRLLGRQMLKSDVLQYWYLHLWILTPNQSGLFADWNRDVRCF